MLRNKYLIPSTILLSAWLVLAAGSLQSVRAQDSQPSKKVLTQYSLFYEYYKNKNYERAAPYLRWLLKNAPTYREETNWERAIKLYRTLAENAESSEVRKAYLDTAYTLHQAVIDTLGKHGIDVDTASWTLDRGRFLQKYSEVYPDSTSAVMDAYLKAYKLSSEPLHPYYIRFIVDRYVAQDKRQQALDFMKQVEQRYPENKRYKKLYAYFDKQRNALFTNPKERVAFLEEQLEENPKDLQILTELTDLYEQLGRTEQRRSILERRLKIKPTVGVYRELAGLSQNAGNYKRAINYYKKALDIAEDGSTTERDLYQSIARIHSQLGNLQRARQFARRAIDIDPKYGDAYMLIGDLYVSAVQNSATMDREDRAVYWLAVDYYRKAMQVDPNVSSRAKQSIRTYRKYFPSQEDLFFKNWEPGEEYTIDYGPYSWIDETTTVKKPPASG